MKKDVPLTYLKERVFWNVNFGSKSVAQDMYTQYKRLGGKMTFGQIGNSKSIDKRMALKVKKQWK